MQNDTAAFFHFDYRAQAAVEYVLTKGGIDHRRHFAERLVAVAAGEIRHILHGQSGLLRNDIDVRGILQRRVRQLILALLNKRSASLRLYSVSRAALACSCLGRGLNVLYRALKCDSRTAF